MKTRLGARALEVALLGALFGGCTEDAPAPKTANDMAAADAGALDGAVAGDGAVVADDGAAPDLGPEPDLGPLVDAATPPPEPVAVETRLGAFATAAGFANQVTCQVLDAQGEVIEGFDTRYEVRPDAGWRTDADRPDELVGEVAGRYDVTCTAPALGLRDGTPERWDVLPGDPARLVAEISPPTVLAGEPAQARCSGTDALGNPVDVDAAQVVLSPANAGVAVDGRAVVVTTSGRYGVGCRLAGVESTVDTILNVRPGLPAELSAGLRPEREVYPLGVVVGYPALVTDIYGNPVEDAELAWTIEPELPGFGEARYLAATEGRYTVSVAVQGEVHEDRVLEAADEFVVDGGGPAIQCEDPVDGSMLTVAPGARGTLRVRVNDQLGIEAVSVDGVAARPDGAGVYVADVSHRFGLNAHDVVARDAAGNETSTFCSWSAAPRYVGENAAFPDGVVLHLSQAAVDDGAPDNPLTSLTDLVRRVVNSAGLVTTIDAALSAQNPIVPNDCRVRVPIIGSCLVRFGATYSSMSVGGPNAVSAQLVNGGLRVSLTVRNLTINGRATGTITPSFRVNVDSIRVVVTFDISLRNGQPDVRVRRTDEITVGRIDLDLPGTIGDLFDGVVDLIFGAFEGLVRDEVSNAINGFLRSEVDALLSDVLSNLDLASLGAAFQIPALFGGDPVALSFGLAFSAMNANAQRLRIGIAASVNGPNRRPGQTAGVAVPPGPAAIELDPDGTLGAAVHVVLLNQALHRLWRAGVFDIGDAGALLGDLPEGVSLSLDIGLPPMVQGLEGDPGVELSLGPATGALTYPGLFDEPLHVRLAARAEATVALEQGNTLAFGGIRITDLKVAFDVPMTPEARAGLEADLRRIIQAIIDSALNEALPDLPIPDFALPDALTAYGVPRGTRLGLRAPTLSGSPSHLTLDGRFGQ
ncbi:MAG: hypothetical protein KC613_04400 [Myxococcales bacterium]|nr:hypothetical protein [Myxococcales bacterium]MCB9522041.1 hypothetical protein [Myxococcales bacterium]